MLYQELLKRLVKVQVYQQQMFTVLDSSFTDQALKFQVVEAAKLAQEGKDLETILTHVEDVKITLNSTSVFQL